MSTKNITINSNLSIPYSELTISHAKSGGPGGQNVNKVNTKVFVRWNPALSAVVCEELCQKILNQCSLTTGGEILVSSTKFRSQSQNLEDCLEKLTMLIQKAIQPSKKRIKTKVSKGAKKRRLENKKKHSQKKQQRMKVNY